jgi:hypothetical protein
MKKLILPITLSGIALGVGVCVAQREYKSGVVWPEPAKVTPGEKPGDPPSDANVLFDGKDLSKFDKGENWKVENGYAIVQKSDITTKDAFGDMQLHLEWMAPENPPANQKGQGRGNSGVYIMGRYEIQILDSYDNPTYFDGQAGAIYKQQPPMVNANRKPGEWQTYDILFEAPKFDKDGKVLKPAYITLFHNGVCVQNHTELTGGTYFDQPAKYVKHAEKAPFRLQNHGNPVKFRNIWVREIVKLEGKQPEKKVEEKKE